MDEKYYFLVWDLVVNVVLKLYKLFYWIRVFWSDIKIEREYFNIFFIEIDVEEEIVLFKECEVVFWWKWKYYSLNIS